MGNKFSKNKGNFSQKRPPKKSFGQNKNFSKASSFSEYINPEKVNIKEITVENKGESFSITGSVDRVVQTGGPTIFYVSDGTATIALKAFEGAGVRSHPDIDIGDVVQASIQVEEYNGELEGEVKKISKVVGDDKKLFLEKLVKLEKERAKVTMVPFLVENQILEKLKDRFVKAATEIRLAIIQNRPIIVRHHNDTDGYSSGFALERAILPLISAQHSSAKAAWEFYTRAPCNAPMYEIDDSIRDTAHSLAAVAKFSNKMPLVIIADTGSGEEDLMGIKQGRVHGEDFIVIDHHRFDKDVISDEVLVHINPFLVGEDGAKYSAGMLCAELSRFINPVESIIPIPAMAGLADRINNPEVMDKYIKLAATKGYEKSLLGDIGAVIDFVSAKLRFMEAREYIEVVFGEPMDKQKQLVALLAPYIQNLEQKGLQIAKAAAKTEEIGGITVQTINIDETFPRGFYPKPGKCTGLVHDDLQVQKKLTRVVTLGIMLDAVTMRATDQANFSVQKLIEDLNEKIPEAFVEGGGHKNAGSIKFLPSKQKEVLKLIRDYIKTI
jgi:RecJ-like exonuclease